MSDQTKLEPEFQQMGAPGEEHLRFADFVGTFRATVKLWMGPREPNVSTGTMVNSMDLGGRYLFECYTGDPAEGPFPNFEGRGYWGFNTTTSKYEGFWIDNASTAMQTEVGEVDASGRVWTMTGEVVNPQNGSVLKKRTVIRLKDRDHHSMESFFAGPDGHEFKGMEIEYERTS